MRKIPGIACDIDGVLIRGSNNPIKSALSAIHRIRSPLNTWTEKFKKDSTKNFLPFVCLTNSGGSLEKSKAEQINRLLKLDSDEKKLKSSQIVLNFTPFRPIIETYKDKTVLIVGRGKLNNIMEDCGVFQYISTKEYNSLSSFENSLNTPLQQRLRIDSKSNENLKKILDISAIFILNDPIDWEENILLISHLLSKNSSIPMYSAHNDALYSDEFPLPRFGIGGFNEVLLRLLSKLNSKSFKLIYSGKPLSLAFECSKIKLKELAKPYEISNFYMIGDNPNVDVLGGKNNGFKTILVRTGVFKEGENDKNNPADFVVNDIEEAIQLITRLEGL